MFCARYFAPRYFAPRYFPEVGQDSTGTSVTFKSYNHRHDGVSSELSGVLSLADVQVSPQGGAPVSVTADKQAVIFLDTTDAKSAGVHRGWYGKVANGTFRKQGDA